MALLKFTRKDGEGYRLEPQELHSDHAAPMKRRTDAMDVAATAELSRPNDESIEAIQHELACYADEQAGEDFAFGAVCSSSSPPHKRTRPDNPSLRSSGACLELLKRLQHRQFRSWTLKVKSLWLKKLTNFPAKIGDV